MPVTTRNTVFLATALAFMVTCTQELSPLEVTSLPPTPATSVELDGLWIVDSIATTVEAGADNPAGVVELHRAAHPVAVRGDAHYVPLNEFGGSFEWRQIMTVDNLATTDVETKLQYVTLLGDQWLLQQMNGHAAVYYVDHVGDRVTLTWDETHPWNWGPTPPLEISLVQVPDWSYDLVGDWHVKSMFSSSGAATTLDFCHYAGEKGLWTKIHVTVDMTDNFLFTRTTEKTHYADLECTDFVKMETLTETGFAEARTHELRVWTTGSDFNRYVVYDVDVEKTSQVLTKRYCQPADECRDLEPAKMVLDRILL